MGRDWKRDGTGAASKRDAGWKNKSCTALRTNGTKADGILFPIRCEQQLPCSRQSGASWGCVGQRAGGQRGHNAPQSSLEAQEGREERGRGVASVSVPSEVAWARASCTALVVCSCLYTMDVVHSHAQLCSPA
jgi:hypothetical protein